MCKFILFFIKNYISNVNENSAFPTNRMSQFYSLEPNINSEVRAESLTHEKSAMFGMAVAFSYQLFKEPVDEDHDVWCCIKGDEDPIPQAYIMLFQ